jgi:hypothetical protein
MLSSAALLAAESVVQNHALRVYHQLTIDGNDIRFSLDTLVARYQ